MLNSEQQQYNNMEYYSPKKQSTFFCCSGRYFGCITKKFLDQFIQERSIVVWNFFFENNIIGGRSSGKINVMRVYSMYCGKTANIIE